MAANEAVPLSDLAIGEAGEIVKVGAVGEIKQRLLEMGMTPGVRVEVERLAPLGDPVEIKLLGYHLSLRRSEAAGIAVRKIKA
jgi:Fe2+ transport system protein FeoA